MTRMEQLNCEEKNAVEELKLRMEKELHPILSEDESIFYRFLRARDFNVDKAEKMLRKHIHWRKAHQIDTILEYFKPKEVYCKYIEPSVIGFDRDGDVILYQQLGRIIPDDIHGSVKMNNYMKHFIWSFEKIYALLKDRANMTQKFVSRVTFILDLDQLAFSSATSKSGMEGLLRVLNILQDNYPDRLKAAYMINSPSFYVLAFSVVKRTLSSAMIKKFHVCGYNNWKEKFLENIDADVLPGFLGGNRTDPDGNPLCKTFVTHIYKIPSSYRLSEKDRYFQDIAQVKKVLLPARQKTEIYLEVEENGSTIQWEFFVRGKDIGFGLAFHTPYQRVEMLPIEKYSTYDGTEEGSFKCKSIGKYSIIFDNSYSRMSSKEVEYIIKVMKISE